MGAGCDVFHNQSVDVGLRHGWAKAFFACIKHQGFATGEFQYGLADQAVVNDHISLVQGAARFHGQKVRVTGACADEVYVPFAGFVGEVRCELIMQGCFDSGLAIRNRCGAGFEVKFTPEIAAGTAHGQGIGHFAKAFANARQSAECIGQLGLKIRFDRACENRGRAFGADRDRDRVTVHNSGGDELAVAQIVDDIDERTVCMCDSSGAGVFCFVFGGGVEKRGAERVARLHRPCDQGQLAGLGPVFNLRGSAGGYDRQLGFGLQQQTQFGQRGFTTA